jgi:hypothetical protein
VVYLDKSRGRDISAPSIEIEKAGKAISVQSFLVVSSRVGAEQDAIGLQGGMQVA